MSIPVSVLQSAPFLKAYTSNFLIGLLLVHLGREGAARKGLKPLSRLPKLLFYKFWLFIGQIQKTA